MKSRIASIAVALAITAYLGISGVFAQHVARMEHRVIRVLDYVSLHPGYKDVSLA
jgi:hypothetical protein